ncbi:hypothetical protein CF121_10935 [Aeromonas media]|nr:hypothetical protein CF121_10935 [Aeromonas media]
MRDIYKLIRRKSFAPLSYREEFLNMLEYEISRYEKYFDYVVIASKIHGYLSSRCQSLVVI